MNTNKKPLYDAPLAPLSHKYLSCYVTRHNGNAFENPLKLSEAHLVSQLAQENAKVEVTLSRCTRERYCLLFGF